MVEGKCIKVRMAEGWQVEEQLGWRDSRSKELSIFIHMTVATMSQVTPSTRRPRSSPLLYTVPFIAHKHL